jgi:hypothetical protein
VRSDPNGRQISPPKRQASDRFSDTVRRTEFGQSAEHFGELDGKNPRNHGDKNPVRQFAASSPKSAANSVSLFASSPTL